MKSIAKKNSFTLIEALIGILAVSMICLVLSSAVLSVSKVNHFSRYEEAEEIVAINQLRRYLAQYPLGEQREGNVMTFETDKGTYKLYEKRGKLMVHPGAMTFLSGIRNLTFYEQGDFIYMSFWRNGKERNVWIAINE